MSQRKTTCQKPDQLKGIAQKCTPEQIQKWHGTGKDHPCAPSGKKE